MADTEVHPQPQGFVEAVRPERSVSPSRAVALSPDGRQFQFRGAAQAAFEPGGLVVLGDAGETRQLGQIEEVEFSLDTGATGSGRVLGALTDSETRLNARATHAFARSTVTAASADTVETLYAGARTTLPIGSFLAADAVPARLLPHRFNRHTFWCGQSGSGKTYALGVVLEQLLIHTDLPMVIFDPNADFVRIREPRLTPGGVSREGASGGGAGGDGSGSARGFDDLRALAQRDIRILRPSTDAPLRVRFVDMPLSTRAAVLHLHPLDDRAEHNELIHFEETVGLLPPDRVVSGLHGRGTAAALDLAARIENLRVTDWSVWAGGREAVTDVLDERPDAAVLDLGGFAYPDESLVVAIAVLDDLWAKREQRRPMLIVIDEAHNLCSPDNTSPLHVAVRERIIQIAAEGRKFGLWLLLSTQRPSRIHSSIISQCDNLALMKMTSPVDVEELATIFGFVPPAMLARAARFTQGEALFAGGFVPAPTMVRIGERLTREGGADVGVPIREPRR
jgi:DNA helicase HerA-like ATPase